jgi:hypothetical protein
MPGTSIGLVVAQLILLAMLVVLGILGALRWVRRARAAELSFRPGAPLQPGDAVIHGTVERSASGDVAVRVEIDQEGSESESSGSWSTSWKERRRFVRVSPFYIRHASGPRIRVEPTHAVQLVDAMDGVIRVNLAKRVRVAELTPGEKVFAVGELRHDLDPEGQGGGYRGGQHGLVMRPQLLSTEPLGARFRRRAGRHRAFLYGLFFMALAPYVFFIPYLASYYNGVQGRAVVTDLKHIEETDSDGTTHTYRVFMTLTEPTSLPGGLLLKRSFSDDVDHDFFVKLKTGMVLPARATFGVITSTHLGPGATFHAGLTLLLLGPVLLLAIIYGITIVQPTAWYEGKLNEGESGRLKESKPPPPEGAQG